MNFGDFKLFYWLSCLALGLVILSPTLAMVVRLPDGERFSELWILGPEHMAEGYPFNVSESGVYKIHLGIGNHMGDLEHYLVYVKFRNQNESLPNSVNGTPSVLPPLFEYRVFLEDGGVWERQVLFSFGGVSHEGNLSKVLRLSLDGSAVNVDKVAAWDQTNKGFYYQLFFELWRYNATASAFQFHDRFVGLWLNVTVAI
jgi:hypothetical protein